MLRRGLLIAVVNLAVTLLLLTVTEWICRRVEQAGIAAKLPASVRELPPKTPSELRVFAFGGSTVYGVPVPEVGFVAQLQYCLQRLCPDRRVRIYNYGWWAEDTGYVLRQLTHRLDEHPDLVIVITGHNEFLGSPPTGRIGRFQQRLAARFATARFLHKGAGLMTKWQESSVMPCQVLAWDRRAAYFKDKMGMFAENMNRIVQAVSARGIPLVVGTLTSNLADWPPVYKRLAGGDRAYLETVSRIQQLLHDHRYQEASDAVNAALGSDASAAMLYFLRGQIQAATGAYHEAQGSFVKARDLDPVPYRATSQINDIVRQSASKSADVHLVDLERVYEEHATNGMVGYDLIADNVHGTPLGESITAQAIIQTMSDIGFLSKGCTATAAGCSVDTFLADVGYSEPRSALRLRAALDNARYVMKTPFLNLDASRMYLRAAMKLDENSWETWANLATLAYLSGDNDTGGKELQRAKELHAKPLDLADRAATPYLREALDFSAGRVDCDAPY